MRKRVTFRARVVSASLIIATMMVASSARSGMRIPVSIWDDGFSTELNENYVLSTAGAGAVVKVTSNQMVLDTGSAVGSARAQVRVDTDQKGLDSLYKGTSFYNFYKNPVRVSFDIASIAGEPGGGRNVFFTSIGYDSGENYNPQVMDQGFSLYIEHHGTVGWRLLASSRGGAEGNIVGAVVALLSGMPTGISYLFDGSEVFVELTGATTTAIGSYGRGTPGGTKVTARLNDLSGHITEYNLAFAALNWGAVDEKTVVTLNSHTTDVVIGGAFPADVLWEDDFNENSLSSSFIEFTQGPGGVSQGDGQLVMNTSTTAGSAQAALNTGSDESGVRTHYNGEDLYNFYDHQVNVRFDIDSIAGSPEGGGRNVFYFTIGKDNAGNYMPQPGLLDDGIGFSLEQISTGWRFLYTSMIGSAAQKNEVVANLSGVPTAITYTLNKRFAEIKLEGATVTAVGAAGRGYIGGTILVVPLCDLSPTISEYRLAFGAHNRGPVSEATVVRLNAMRVDVPDLEGPGGPVAVQEGEFIVKKTGERFYPVGFNYIRLRFDDPDAPTRVHHDTFSPHSYDRDTISADLADIAAAGFNTVRVFLEAWPLSSNSLVASAQDEVFSGRFILNVADFLNRAREQGLYVVITLESMQHSWGYTPYFDPNYSENIVGRNMQHMNPGYIAGMQKRLMELIGMLQVLVPERVHDTIFSFDPRNEVSFRTDERPFNLSSGTVTPANGVTYNMADNEQKALMADEMGIYYINQMADAIQRRVPGALIHFNVYTYHAVYRQIGFFGAGVDNRYPFRPEAMAVSDADYFTLHLYTHNIWELQDNLDSIEFVATSNAWAAAGKPMIIGEFGAQTAAQSYENAVAWKENEVNELAGKGFQGFLYWTYNALNQSSHWQATDGDGSMVGMLTQRAADNYPASQFEWAGIYSAGSDVQIFWDSVPGGIYRILHKGDLMDPYWQLTGSPVAGDGSAVSVSIPDVARKGFFRVRRDR